MSVWIKQPTTDSALTGMTQRDTATGDSNALDGDCLTGRASSRGVQIPRLHAAVESAHPFMMIESTKRSRPMAIAHVETVSVEMGADRGNSTN
jgi:hypothetical protein